MTGRDRRQVAAEELERAGFAVVLGHDHVGAGRVLLDGAHEAGPADLVP